MRHEIDRRRMMLWSSALAGASALGLSPGAAAQQAKLVVNTYGGRWEKFWRSDLLPPFTKATGINPTVDVGLGKNFIANLRAADTESGVESTPQGALFDADAMEGEPQGRGSNRRPGIKESGVLTSR